MTVTNPADTVILKISAEADDARVGARDLAEAWIAAMIVEIDEIEGDGTEGSAPVTVIAGDSASAADHPHLPRRADRHASSAACSASASASRSP